jgi:nitronate monooxygenase
VTNGLLRTIYDERNVCDSIDSFARYDDTRERRPNLMYGEGIRTPVVAAAMAGISGGRLAAAVTNGGGFGFMSAGLGVQVSLRHAYLSLTCFVVLPGRAPSADKVIHEIDVARASLKDTRKGLLPIGVGFFGYELDAQPQMVKILDSVLNHRVLAIWLSFGEDLGKWVRYIREKERDRGVDRTLIFLQLPTAADAFKASSDWDIDAIVLQGWWILFSESSS